MMMNDPMAGIGEGGPKEDTNTKTMFDQHAHMYNLSKIDKARSLLSIVTGCCTGILGCTGFQGFMLFFLSHLFISVAIWLVSMKGTYKNYGIPGSSIRSFLSADLQKSGMSFTLFWTLFYGLCYLF